MSRNVSLCAAMALTGIAAACGGGGGDHATERLARTAQRATVPMSSPATPVALAIEIENGVGVPLSVRAGQTFYLNQIDLRVFQNTSVDEGVAALTRSGDWASLDWSGLQLVDQAPIILQNADGTTTYRHFFRFAKWMNTESNFLLEQVDSNGVPTAPPVELDAGREFQVKGRDDYWDRRFRAIQWTNDCASASDCSTATSFQEEALVELRYAQHPEKTFVIQPSTTALRLFWNQKPLEPYTIPLTQIASPQYDYGFSIDIQPLTAPTSRSRRRCATAPGTACTLPASCRATTT